MEKPITETIDSVINVVFKKGDTLLVSDTSINAGLEIVT